MAQPSLTHLPLSPPLHVGPQEPWQSFYEGAQPAEELIIVGAGTLEDMELRLFYHSCVDGFGRTIYW